MKPISSIGIVAFKKSADISSACKRICRWAQRHASIIVFHPLLHGQIPAGATVAATEKDFLSASDALISLGGDGTFLSTVHMSGFSTKPVAGVNLGGLGFLTEISLEDIESYLDKMRAGHYSITQRMVLDVQLVSHDKITRRFKAYNDIFINRAGKPKIISLAAWYGSDFITEFQGDGLVVATPSGSTAYSLSAGGPIVDPEVCAYIIAPLCPHSLTQRPMILSATKPLRIALHESDDDAMFSTDGLHTLTIHGGDEIHIRRSASKIPLIHISQRTYFELLRLKLEWGRNYKKR